jgi:cation transporter-like permease
MTDASVKRDPQPWGKVVALFVGCSATVVGSLRGLTPGELLLRVIVSSVVAGLIVSAFTTLVSIAAVSAEDQ